MRGVGVATGESRRCAPKTFRVRSLAVCMEDDRNLDDRGVESVDEGERESFSGWWESQAPMVQRNDEEEKSAPILGLPDDAMTLVFARLPRQSLAMTRLVCSSWKRVTERQELASLRLTMGTSEGWIYVLAQAPDGTPFRAYDPIAAKWSVLPPIPGRSEDQQWQGFACVAFRHKLLLIGGTRTWNNPYSEAMVCSDVVIFDAITNKWTRGANMNTSRSWAAAAVVGEKVYVAGGQGTTKFLDSAEVYDPHTDTWETISSMGVVRSSCQGAALDGQFWVIAGEYVKNHYDNNQKSSAEVYDAETDTWRFVPNMCLDDNKIMGPSVVVNGDLICVHQKRVMTYNKHLNSWSQLGHLPGGDFIARPYSKFGFACESVGSSLYIIGGTREHSGSRHRYCTPINSVEICDLGNEQQSSGLWWRQGTDMGQGRGIMTASTVLWL